MTINMIYYYLFGSLGAFFSMLFHDDDKPLMIFRKLKRKEIPQEIVLCLTPPFVFIGYLVWGLIAIATPFIIMYGIGWMILNLPNWLADRKIEKIQQLVK